MLDELRAADVVLCEDTRVTRVLLERHEIKAKLLSYHEHNEAKRTAELVPRLVAGERMALVTDAGLPGVSDPGARLVAAALDAGVPVTVLPGPSAVDTALVVVWAGRRALPVHRVPAAVRERAARALGRAGALAARGRRVRVARNGCRARSGRSRRRCPTGRSRSRAS